jgi:hypothetical protein
MKEKLLEKYASRAFLSVIGGAITLFAEGKVIEGGVLVGAFVLGDYALKIAKVLKGLPL